MQNLNIYTEIPNMPISDQKSCEVFAKNLNQNLEQKGIKCKLEFNYSKDVWHIFGQILEINNIQKIKGPLQNTSAEIFFREKYTGNNFFYENGVLYTEIRENDIKSLILNIFLKNLKSHSWSIKAKWNTSGEICCRPLKNIAIYLNNEFINGSFAHVKFYEQSYKLINQEEKHQTLIEKTKNLNLNKEHLFNNLIYLVNDPEIMIFEFDQKFLKIPSKIIQSFLEIEQNSLLIYENGEMTNKILCLVEKNLELDVKKFQNSANAKLIDLLFQYERDMERSVESYQNERNNKIINNQIGSIGDKINRMKVIAKDMNILNESLEEQINLFQLDVTSEIIQENPSLSGNITKSLFPNFIEKNIQIQLLDYIDNLIKFSNFGMLPNSSNDPFGLKKQCDFIIQYLLENELNIDFQKAEEFINHRLKLHLVKINPILNHFVINRRYLHKYLNFSIDFNKIQRIINLVKKINCDQNIELHSIEIRLMDKIQKLSIENINEVLDQIIAYLDYTEISPYIERKNLMENFIDQVKKIIDLDSIN